MAPRDLILDTNVVLDWLVFGHASARPYADGLAAGRLRWIGTRASMDELEDVLGRLLSQPSLMRWSDRHGTALAVARQGCVLVDSPGPLPHAERLRCTDPDDQLFIDLAIARRTPWLITRDHALLRLARRARPLGVAVCTPETWARLPGALG